MDTLPTVQKESVDPPVVKDEILTLTGTMNGNVSNEDWLEWASQLG